MIGLDLIGTEKKGLIGAVSAAAPAVASASRSVARQVSQAFSPTSYAAAARSHGVGPPPPASQGVAQPVAPPAPPDGSVPPDGGTPVDSGGGGGGGAPAPSADPGAPQDDSGDAAPSDDGSYDDSGDGSDSDTDVQGLLGLDLIGTGEKLSTQTIMIRVRSIDTAKLRDKVAGKKAWGAVLPMAVSLVDTSPEYALGAILPIVKGQLEDLGVTADVNTTTSPPPPNPPHEGLIVLLVGAGLGAVLALLGRKLYHVVAG